MLSDESSLDVSLKATDPRSFHPSSEGPHQQVHLPWPQTIQFKRFIWTRYHVLTWLKIVSRSDPTVTAVSQHHNSSDLIVTRLEILHPDHTTLELISSQCSTKLAFTRGSRTCLNRTTWGTLKVLRTLESSQPFVGPIMNDHLRGRERMSHI